MPGGRGGERREDNEPPGRLAGCSFGVQWSGLMLPEHSEGESPEREPQGGLFSADVLDAVRVLPGPGTCGTVPKVEGQGVASVRPGLPPRLSPRQNRADQTFFSFDRPSPPLRPATTGAGPEVTPARPSPHPDEESTEGTLSGTVASAGDGRPVRTSRTTWASNSVVNRRRFRIVVCLRSNLDFHYAPGPISRAHFS